MKDRVAAPMTLLIVVIALIVVVVGGVCVITGHYDSDYRQWVDDVTKFAIAVGIIGAGRAISKTSRED